MNTGNVSNILNSWISGGFGHSGPLVIWCIILIVVGFKGVRYDKRMMVTGVWLYALSIAIPALQYLVYEVALGTSTRGSSSDAFLQQTGIIIAVLTQLAAAAAVAYPLLAIFTSGKSSDASPDSDARVEVDDGAEDKPSPGTNY